MKSKLIYIVIPVFNRWHFTELCLASLQKQNYHDFKVVIVDHGSTDGTSAKIADLFPEVIVLNGNRSMWWTAATNLGVKYALYNKAAFVLTLNNDTIAECNYLMELIKCSEHFSNKVLIGSKAIDFNTKETIFAGDIENWFWETSFFNHLNKPIMSQNYASCSRFPGRGLLIPVNVFYEVGLFDEIFFPHYLADHEFTHRAIKRGFKIYCAINAILETYPEESTANQLIKSKNLKSYYNHLFGIRGGAQLKIFYIYAFRYCPRYALPTFLLFGSIRRIFGFWLK